MAPKQTIGLQPLDKAHPMTALCIAIGHGIGHQQYATKRLRLDRIHPYMTDQRHGWGRRRECVVVKSHVPGDETP